MFYMWSKRGKKAQVTIFIIIAILLIAAVVTFFLVRGSIQKQIIPSFVEPIETSFLTCLEDNAETGVALLGLNGGHLTDVDFEPGSEYMPFSSHLNFVGNEIPYWFYVSGNNIPRQNVPSRNEMELQLEKYLEVNVQGCGFEDFYGGEYEFSKGQLKADVSIADNSVDVDLKMDLSISKGEDSFLIKDHNVVIKSKLGSLYEDAIEIYEQEQTTLFLEKFGIDTLRLYAPVDGVEIKCSPMIWNANEVFADLKEAMEVNTLALKTAGDKEDYFVIDNSLDSDARFIYSSNWPSTFEVAPNEGSSLVSDPVGNQPGLGILGFCYVTYHFVYNLAYPVLVQVYDGDEIFQFPIAVVIRGNLPREVSDIQDVALEKPYDLCSDKLSSADVKVQDYNFKPVVADVSYECFGSRCNLGKTALDGTLSAKIPQCINGNFVVSSRGFKETKVLYSSVEKGSSTIILDKEFEKKVTIAIKGKTYSGNAIISFSSEDSIQSIAYPENNKIVLGEGNYEVKVQVYKNSSLNFAATTREQCVEIPSSGIGGFVGLTEKECFEVTTPEQIISQVLAGGGVGGSYFSENLLETRDEIVLNIEDLFVPRNLEELQNSYLSFETKYVGVSLR